MPRIGILVVAYNAESTLRSVLDRIPASIWDKIEEVFVFDDASQDRTHEVGKALLDEGRYAGKLEIFRNPVNLMYGGNQRRGYQYAIERGLDIVVLLHGDTQIILEFLKRGYRIKEVPIPTYYGDEICYVNGIPYAMNCVRETLKYALTYRWGARRRRSERDARRQWDRAGDPGHSRMNG